MDRKKVDIVKIIKKVSRSSLKAKPTKIESSKKEYSRKKQKAVKDEE